MLRLVFPSLCFSIILVSWFRFTDGIMDWLYLYLIFMANAIAMMNRTTSSPAP